MMRPDEFRTVTWHRGNSGKIHALNTAVQVGCKWSFTHRLTFLLLLECSLLHERPINTKVWLYVVAKSQLSPPTKNRTLNSGPLGRSVTDAQPVCYQNLKRIILRNPIQHPMNGMFQHLTCEACCTSLRHSYFQVFGKSHCTYFALLGN